MYRFFFSTLFLVIAAEPVMAQNQNMSELIDSIISQAALSIDATFCEEKELVLSEGQSSFSFGGTASAMDVSGGCDSPKVFCSSKGIAKCLKNPFGCRITVPSETCKLLDIINGTVESIEERRKKIGIFVPSTVKEIEYVCTLAHELQHGEDFIGGKPDRSCKTEEDAFEEELKCIKEMLDKNPALKRDSKSDDLKGEIGLAMNYNACLCTSDPATRATCSDCLEQCHGQDGKLPYPTGNCEGIDHIYCKQELRW